LQIPSLAITHAIVYAKTSNWHQEIEVRMCVLTATGRHILFLADALRK